MSDDTVIEPPTSALHAGDTRPRSAAAPVIDRLAKAITPSLRPDARAALRDMRVKDPLREALEGLPADTGLKFADASCDEPYADADGNTLKRDFSLLKSKDDEVVLLQIPDWIANDGANVGAMEEMRDVFANRKVRIVSEGVQTPSLSLDKTLPRIWRSKAMIDVEFVSWRYVMEFLERKLSPAQLFGLASGTAPPSPRVEKTTKRVFISSTGLDLGDYREVARDVCNSLQLIPLMMEYFEAMGLGATQGSKKMLDQADLYVGIFAYRYGYIEKGYDKSVTEVEFDYAEERKLERLCFVVDPKHPWPTDALDFDNHKQMQAFKRRVEETLIRGRFTTSDSLKALLMQALAPHRL